MVRDDVPANVLERPWEETGHSHQGRETLKEWAELGKPLGAGVGSDGLAELQDLGRAMSVPQSWVAM